MPELLFTERAQFELGQRLARCFSGELAEEFLKTLLTLMSIVFVVNRDYRRNIKGFTGRYQFLSKDGRLTMAAVFREGRMEVLERRIADDRTERRAQDQRVRIGFYSFAAPMAGAAPAQRSCSQERGLTQPVR